MDLHIDKKVGVLLAITLLIGGALGFASGAVAVGERFEHGERGMRLDQEENEGERGARDEEKNKYNDDDTETIQITPPQQNTSTSNQASEENIIKTDTATSGAVVGN
jgi:hypothetical protein